MKRIFAFTFAVYLISLPVGLCYASFAAPFVSRLASATASAGSAGGVNVAARITGATSTGANVASWVSLAIPGGNVAKIATAVLAVGGALAADYLMVKGAAWFAENNITRENNILKITETFYLPTDPNAPTTPGPGGGYYAGGNIDGKNAAYAAATAYAAAHCSSGSQFLGSDGQGNFYAVAYDLCQGSPTYGQYSKFYYTVAGGMSNQDIPRTLPASELENMLALDLSNSSATAYPLGLASVQVAAAALDNPNHPVNDNSASKAAIAAALADSISSAQLTNLEAAAVPNVGDNVLPDAEPNVNDLTPAQIAAAVQAALAGQGLSAAQIAAAIAAAQGAAAQGLTAAQAQAAVAAALSGANLSAAQIQAAVEAATAAAFPPVGAYTGGFTANAWAKPIVGDFAGLFSSFLADMRNTPLFSLPGLLSGSVPSGGSCEMSVNMSERFGGSKTISICNWETGLSGVKAALLCVASIFAIGIVTKGGG